MSPWKVKGFVLLAKMIFLLRSLFLAALLIVPFAGGQEAPAPLGCVVRGRRDGTWTVHCREGADEPKLIAMHVGKDERKNRKAALKAAEQWLEQKRKEQHATQ